MNSLSFNAHVAKQGFRAETLLSELPIVKSVLQDYFQKPIQRISLITGRKKSDLLITFQDTSIACIQNKNGTGGGRGWSADRRGVDRMPCEPEVRTLLQNVCLKKGTERPNATQSIEFLSQLLLGTESDYMPTHFTHSNFTSTGELRELSICSREAFLKKLQEELYPNFVPKRTCVHLGPRLYLQRKGGGKKDHAPDDIQLKMKSIPDNIMTCLYPLAQTQTTAIQEPQMPELH